MDDRPGPSEELPKEEAERRAREVAQRMLTTPKSKKPASQKRKEESRAVTEGRAVRGPDSQ